MSDRSLASGSDREAVVLWSGGIDSTAVLVALLWRGWDVTVVSLDVGTLYGSSFAEREAVARLALRDRLDEGAGRRVVSWETHDAAWLTKFGRRDDPGEVPRRNKRCIDYVYEAIMRPRGISVLAMGEYVGCDTWVVQDHVPAADCDARSLEAYVFHEYGMGVRLVTLRDFGESRFKADRLSIGSRLVPDAEFWASTSNCLKDETTHCGECYKCRERHAAFAVVFGTDPTKYIAPPDPSAYLAQMGRTL